MKIKHVVFIVKENRTFDEVFGDLYPSDATFQGDLGLARWGERAEVKEKNEATIPDARVTPNHHALARRFALSDNFYVDSDVSVDGHHWLVGNYPNEVVESEWPAGYGHKLDFIADADAPGRLSLDCGNPCPETYLEAGSLWEHLARHQITFRNYGEGVSFPGGHGDAGLMPTGVREAVNLPMPEVLFENTSRSYADLQHEYLRPIPLRAVPTRVRVAVCKRQGAAAAIHLYLAAQRSHGQAAPGRWLSLSRFLCRG